MDHGIEGIEWTMVLKALNGPHGIEGIEWTMYWRYWMYHGIEGIEWTMVLKVLNWPWYQRYWMDQGIEGIEWTMYWRYWMDHGIEGIEWTMVSKVLTGPWYWRLYFKVQYNIFYIKSGFKYISGCFNSGSWTYRSPCYIDIKSFR